MLRTRAGGGIGRIGHRFIGVIIAASGPTVANSSALGAAPVILSATDTGYDAGARVQWEFAASLTPAKNVDGSYTTPSQSGVTFIDGDSWARMDLALGYSTPSGAYSFHFRVLIDNENGLTTVVDQFGQSATYDAQTWSNDFPDTIGGSVALLTSTTGTSKSRFVAVASPFHQGISTSDVGSPECVRASIPMAVAKGHFEFTIDGLKSASAGAVNCGVCAGAADTGGQDFNSTGFNGTRPGSGSSIPGVTARIAQGGTTVTIYRNGGNQSVNTPGSVAAAQGDALIFEVDNSNPAAPSVAISYYRLATTTTTLLATITMTGAYIPASIWAFGATERGTGATTTFNTSDAFTFNPGYATFLSAASAGFSPYG